MPKSKVVLLLVGFIKNRVVLLFLGFIIGFAACIGFGAAVSHFDTEITFPDRLVREWGLSLDEAGRLFIPLQESAPNGDIAMVVVIERDVENGKLVEVEVDGERMDFKYKTLGPLGVPYARYGAGDMLGAWMAWADLNADGHFDKRYDMDDIMKAKGMVEVLIDGKWVQARKSPGATALVPEGPYVFSLDTGVYEREPTK